MEGPDGGGAVQMIMDPDPGGSKTVDPDPDTGCYRCVRAEFSSQTKFLVPDWGDVVDSGIGMYYRPARPH
jgi:hypothetical protein